MRSRTIRVFALLLIAALAASGQSRTPVYQVVVSADPVSLDVSVTDARGKAVTTLTADDFTLYEDGKPQAIDRVSPVGLPFSILILVDRSGKREENPSADLLLKSLDLFLRVLRGPDRFAVAAFDNRVAVLADWRPMLRSRSTAIRIRPSDQKTEFYSALDWASQEMRGIRGRRGVVIFTDGRDREMYPKVTKLKGETVVDPDYAIPASAEGRFRQTLEAVSQARLPYYFVAIDTDRQLSPTSAALGLESWKRFLEGARSQMEQLAEASGGRVFFPADVDEVLPLYHQIQEDLGTGYHIEYSAAARPPVDRKTRQIEIRVQNPNLRVSQSQDSYYAR